MPAANTIITLPGGAGRVRPPHPLAHPHPGGALEMLFQPGVVELPPPTNIGPDAGRFLTVLGPDDRERRIDTIDPPLRAICSLVMTAASGVAMIGTGFLVGRRTVMTCAHNLLKRPPNGQFDAASVTVRPGREVSRTPDPFGAHTATAADWFIHPQWEASQAAGHDFALIRLPEPVGDTTGWLGFAALSGRAIAARMVNLAGYPACVGRCAQGQNDPGNIIPPAERGAQLWWQRDRIRRTDADQLFYDLDTFGGNSGSPVILMPVAGDGWTGPTAVGIHTRGTNHIGDPFEAEHNTATRLTDALFDMAIDFLNARDG
jgi:V8-like Glu-specific endopeptidase